jgi:hypothetical protein
MYIGVVYRLNLFSELILCWDRAQLQEERSLDPSQLTAAEKKSGMFLSIEMTSPISRNQFSVFLKLKKTRLERFDKFVSTDVTPLLLSEHQLQITIL